MAIDLADAYEQTQANVAALVRDLPDARLGAFVPASPDWTVQDVVAHVTGIAADLGQGRIPMELDLVRSLNDETLAAQRESLTARQVEERRGRSIDEVIDEWDSHMPALLAMIRGEQPFPAPVPFAEAIIVTDLAVHAQDIRGALGTPGDRDSAAVSMALLSYVAAFGLKLREAGLPAMRFVYDGKERVAGDGEPAATLTARRFEVFRALAGRRSRDQILAMDWHGDPLPFVALIPAYGERLDAVSD
jgi:uncharacterized protein (TIGR03083 family)